MRIPTNFFFLNQTDIISSEYDSVARLQQQANLGKKLLAPSDDPVLSARINLQNDYIANLQSYENNGTIAQNRMQMFDAATKSSIEILDKIKQTLVAAANETLSDNDRQVLAEQVKGYLTSMLSIANTQDGSGQYVFSGDRYGDVPYIQENGAYKYNGGMHSTTISVSQYANVIYNESGYRIFDDNLTGNGVFTVSADDANTGNAYTGIGSVTNDNSYVADNYTITFVTNSSGKLGYEIAGASSGQVVPPPPATIPADAPDFNPDTSINFNGVSLNFSGNPNVGDSFKVQSSQKENIFNSLDQLVNVLSKPLSNDATAKAQFHQQLNQLSGSFDQIFNHMSTYQSEIGTRQSYVTEQVYANQANITQQTTLESELSNANMFAVLSSLSQQSLSLQVLTKTYGEIQDLFMQMLRG